MRLYEGTSVQFIQDTIQNEIADKLELSFENHYGRRVNPREKNSWINSLQFLKNTLEQNKLDDLMVVLENELPYSNERLDCLLFGRSDNNKESAVIIELKQWSAVEDSEIENNIITYVGGANRMEAHPSFQVRGYHYHLKDFVKCFDEESPVDLHSCAYCHNYSHNEKSVLFFEKFAPILNDFPTFAKEDFQLLGTYLKERLGNGKGLEIFNRFIESPIQPSKKLIEYTSNMIKGQKVFNLIDEQIAANNTIIDRAKKSSKLKKKAVIIVRGGPGTGKSVIGLNALSELLDKGLVVFHATGSSAFTTTLRKIVGSRPAKLFKYFNSFQDSKWQQNAIDVLICDEAHRIRTTSNNRYTKKEFKSTIPQIDELIQVAKVSIFFIDDYQIVRPDEIGSTELIKATAEKYNADIYDFELTTQFRCNGSNGYLNWVDDVLGIRDTANKALTKEEKMEVKIFGSPEELYNAILEKNKTKDNSARLVGGYCWPWSNANLDGTLVRDVVIGDFKMPWEAKNESKILLKDIPRASVWAYDAKGLGQIGTVYTVQGFEYEYIGIIFGNDMVYDPELKEWVGHPENSADSMVKKDKDKFLQNIKNVYRVLMTRGMKGCYIYFLDKETEEYIKSKIEIH